MITLQKASVSYLTMPIKAPSTKSGFSKRVWLQLRVCEQGAQSCTVGPAAFYSVNTGDQRTKCSQRNELRSGLGRLSTGPIKPELNSLCLFASSITDLLCVSFGSCGVNIEFGSSWNSCAANVL